MTTGERIRKRRTDLGLTQEDLGKRLGVQKSAISKIERGAVVNLKRDIIAKLGEALECSPAYLMGWDEDDEHDSQVSLAVSLLNQLSPEGLQTVISLLRQLTSGRE